MLCGKLTSEKKEEKRRKKKKKEAMMLPTVCTQNGGQNKYFLEVCNGKPYFVDLFGNKVPHHLWKLNLQSI